MPDIVRLRNNSDATFKDQYASVPYVAQPGDAILVPFDAACLWFGDPRLSDRPTLSQYDRKDEYDRVFHRSGYAVKEVGGEEYTIPDYAIEDLEGNPIYMTLWDPEGNKLTLSNSSNVGLNDSAAIAQELEIVKRQQAALLQRLEELQAPDAPGLDDIPTDNPTKVPVTQEA